MHPPGDQLLSALMGRYDVVEEKIRIADRVFSLSRVRDTNALLENLSAEDLSCNDRFPFWAQLWESSLALAEWSLSSPRLEGATVLELGAGLGLAGIAAASAGAHVTLTDYASDALTCATLNAVKNLSPGECARTSVAHLDWRSTFDLPRHDFIIGADILYETTVFQPLMELFRAALAPGGSIVLADPDRATGRLFLASAEEHGFTVSAHARVVHRHGGSCRITIAELREQCRE